MLSSLSVYVSLCMHVCYLFVSMYVNICVCVSFMSVFMHVCVCVCVCVCVWWCVCVCVCVLHGHVLFDTVKYSIYNRLGRSTHEFGNCCMYVCMYVIANIGFAYATIMSRFGWFCYQGETI